MHEQSGLQFIKDKAGRTCPTCGKDVVGRADKVHCSKRCKTVAWRESNPEKHKESARKSHKKWKKANPGKVKESDKRWKQANPEKRKAQKHRRRARLKGNGIEDTSDYRARMTNPLVRQVCFYCGADCTGEFHWDHRIPLAAGGPDAEWNLVIACPSCNLIKGAKVPKTLFAEEIFNES